MCCKKSLVKNVGNMTSMEASGARKDVRIKTPKRYRCSPAPPTAELINAIVTRPKSSPCLHHKGIRPLTTRGYRSATRERTIRPTTVVGRRVSATTEASDASTQDTLDFEASCAFVRKRLQEIREARRRKIEKEEAENETFTKNDAGRTATSERKIGFFKRAEPDKKIVFRKIYTLEELEEEQRRKVEEKLKVRHARMTKLIWWFRVFRAICELAHDMKNLSMAITEQSVLSQVYVYNACGYPGLLDEQSLFFDKSQFSRRKTMLFPVWAQKLALKNPDSRSEEDVRQIRAVMLMMKSFREKFTEAMQYKMAKVAMYINCEKGRVILRQGHWGLNFYFIYSGSVFVQKATRDPKTKEVKTQTENIIKAGESFGEIAILGDGKRTASIICREPTEVFQVDKYTFLETCWEIFEEELEKKIQFARAFELFREWDAENFKRLCFMSQSIYIPYGKVIEADWSDTIYVYFVMQGRISLMRQFQIADLGDTEDVSLSGMMDKPLYLPDPDKDKYGGNWPFRYANVGELHVGDHSDLRVILNDKDVAMDKLSLVSQGVKVLRVENRLMRWLGPMDYIDDYLRKRYTPFRVPSDKRLCQRYVEETNWDDFKAKTLRQVSLTGGWQNLAMVPVTEKGSSGWGRWPGSGVYRGNVTTFHSPREPRHQLADFVIEVSPPKTKTEKTKYLLRRDTIGVPIEMRRTSLFPRSRLHKQILRTADTDNVQNDRRLMMLPPRPNLSRQRAKIQAAEERLSKFRF